MLHHSTLLLNHTPPTPDILSCQQLVGDLFTIHSTCEQYNTGNPSVLQQYVNEATAMLNAGLTMLATSTEETYADSYVTSILRIAQMTRSTQPLVESECGRLLDRYGCLLLRCKAGLALSLTLTNRRRS